MEHFAHFAIGISLTLRRRLAEAIPVLRRAIHDHPETHATLFLASVLAHSGDLEGAHDAMALYLRYRPHSSVRKLRQGAMWRVAADYDFVLEGARLAGLPE